MGNITETGRHEGTDRRPSSINLLEESNGEFSAPFFLIIYLSQSL
jgi:hypothetical protein